MYEDAKTKSLKESKIEKKVKLKRRFIIIESKTELKGNI